MRPELDRARSTPAAADRRRKPRDSEARRHRLRALRAPPGYTCVTVLTLAIGIGGNAAIFGAVNAVLLRPLPYPEPDQLMRVYKTNITQPNRVGGTVSPPDFTDWRHDNTTFSEMGAFDSDT